MKIYCIFILLFCIINVDAQNEANFWYFGDKAGINFSLGERTIMNDSEMNTPAGCSSISDKEGNLLFYTNGRTIWNKNHQIMENGEVLAGDINNTQTSIIIPKPGSNEIFYLFSTKLGSSTNPLLSKGLYVSLIEISSKFPLGIVQSKSQRLRDSVTEKISAVHSKDGKSIYVVAFGSLSSADESPSDTFFVFNISENGLTSNLITITESIISADGAMKISPNGKYIAVAGLSDESIYLYNFDNETGEISFFKKFETFIFTSIRPPYGLEFSLDSKILYFTSESTINKYFVESPFPNDPLFSLKQAVFNAAGDNFGSLQLSTDGKIYVSSYTKNENLNVGANYLTIIDDVNKLIPKINYRALKLESGNSLLGLPNFIQSYFLNRITAKNNCVTEIFDFEVGAYTNIETVFWEFGDGNTSTETSPKHKYMNPGVYKVVANISLNGELFKIYKNLEVYALPSLKPNVTITQCDDDFDGLSVFNLFNARSKIANFTNFRNVNFTFYTTQNDALNEVNNIKTPENFANTVSNQDIFTRAESIYGCASFTSFKLNARFVQLGNISDVFACESTGINAIENEALFDIRDLDVKVRNETSLANDAKLRFFSSYNDALSNTDELFFEFSKPTATIYVKAQEPDFSCGGITSINLIVNPKPVINIKDSYTICFDPNLKPPIIINAAISNDSFEWRNSQGNIISENNSFTLNSVGEFSLTVYKTQNGITCNNTQTFSVVNPKKPTFSNITVNTEDERNNIIEITIMGNSTYEFSLDALTYFGNTTFYTFTNVDAGLRTVYVKDINNCEQPIQITVSVIGFKKFFTPNGDGDNDFWNVSGLDATSFKSIIVNIFDRYGKLISSITDFNSPGWDGTYNGKNLIANNYWYKAQIIDKENNLINSSGNFSLIRN